MRRWSTAPAGKIRLNVPEHAASLLLGPVLPTFIDRYPDIEVDLSVSNHLVDIVEQGFDAGMRYGGTVPEDMIALRLSPDIRWVTAASPAYLAKFGTPEHPNDLSQHRCVRFRLGDDRIYHWEYEKGEEEIAVEVSGALALDETQTALALAVGGAGFIYVPEPCVAPLIKTGALKEVLADWAPMGPGFHIYYSGRRQLPTGLRLLVELIRELHPLGI